MKLSECMHILKLGESASINEIKQAYRYLVQKNHPDKHNNHQKAHKEFIKISTAYRTLMQATRAVESGKKVGVCCQCRHFGEVRDGRDGLPRCDKCLLSPGGGRLLPLPVIVVAKCISTLVLIAITTYLIVLAVGTKNISYAVAAFITGLAALAVLAHTCITVVYCITPREQARKRAKSKRI